ncbi:hypothetical protein VUR80DRAFT_10343 [Thermomyces stellatus]
MWREGREKGADKVGRGLRFFRAKYMRASGGRLRRRTAMAAGGTEYFMQQCSPSLGWSHRSPPHVCRSRNNPGLTRFALSLTSKGSGSGRQGALIWSCGRRGPYLGQRAMHSQGLFSTPWVFQSSSQRKSSFARWGPNSRRLTELEPHGCSDMFPPGSGDDRDSRSNSVSPRHFIFFLNNSFLVFSSYLCVR